MGGHTAIIALIAGHLLVATLTLLRLLRNIIISKQWYDDVLSLFSVASIGILLHHLFTLILGSQSNHPIQYRLEISVYFLVTALSRSSVALASLRLRLRQLYTRPYQIFTWVSLSTYMITGVVFGVLSARFCVVNYSECENGSTCICHPPRLLWMLALPFDFLIDLGLAYRNWNILDCPNGFPFQSFRLTRAMMLFSLSSNLLIFLLSLIFFIRYTMLSKNDPIQMVYLINSTAIIAVFTTNIPVISGFILRSIQGYLHQRSAARINRLRISSARFTHTGSEASIRSSLRMQALGSSSITSNNLQEFHPSTDLDITASSSKDLDIMASSSKDLNSSDISESSSNDLDFSGITLKDRDEEDSKV